MEEQGLNNKNNHLWNISDYFFYWVAIYSLSKEAT